MEGLESGKFARGSNRWRAAAGADFETPGAAARGLRDAEEGGTALPWGAQGSPSAPCRVPRLLGPLSRARSRGRADGLPGGGGLLTGALAGARGGAGMVPGRSRQLEALPWPRCSRAPGESPAGWQ